MILHPLLLRCFAAVAVCVIALDSAASGRPFGERGMHATPHETQQVRVAFAGGRFLTAWVETRGQYGSAIMGSLSDAGGNAVSAQPFVITTLRHSFIYNFHVLGTGDSFALFHQQDSITFLIRVSAEGAVLAHHSLSGAVRDYACQAWNGSRFACTGRSGVFNSSPSVAFLDARGNLVKSPKAIATSAEPAPRLVAAHWRFFAVSTHDGLSLAPLSKDGYGIRAWLSDDRMSSVINAEAVDEGLLTVWSSGPDGVLKSAIVRRDGTVSPVVSLTTSVETSVPVAIMTRPGGFLLLFARGGYGDRHELQSMLLDADGRPAGDEKLLVLLEPAMTTGGDVAVAAGSGTMGFHSTLPGIIGPVMLTVRPDGETRSPRVLGLALDAQSAPVLGRGEGRAVAVLTQRSGPTTTTHAGHVDGGGSVTWVTVPTHEFRSPELPWNGSEYLSLHHDREILYGTLLTNDGLPIGEPIRIVEMKVDSPEVEARPAAIWAGDLWVVVWPRETLHFSMTTITRDGSVAPVRKMTPPIALPRGHWRWHLAIALAWDGQDILLSWAQHQPPPCMQPLCDQGPLRTYASRITRSGEFADAPLELPSSGLEAYESDSLSVATSGQEFLVAAGASVSVVAADGVNLRLIHAESLPANGAASDAAWDGRDYVVASRRTISVSESRLVITRLDRGGRILREIETNIVASASYRDAAPSVVPLWPGEVLVGVQEENFASGPGAYVHRESDLLPRETNRRRAVRR